MKLEQTYETVDCGMASAVLKQSNGTPVVLFFSAKWTGSGLMLDKIYEELAQEYATQVRFVRMDAEQSKRCIAQFGILQIPTTLIYKHNEVKDHFEGLCSKKSIKQKIDRIVEFT